MDFLKTAIDAATRSGEMLKSEFRSIDRSKTEFKSARDPVTALDRHSQEMIVETLSKKYPDHGIIAEEDDLRKAGDSARWIVDPLDGTVNYLHGSPMYGVSIALEVDDELRVGVVHAPTLGETYYAEKGGGAFRDGKPIRVSGTSKPIESLLATGFAYRRSETTHNNLENFSRLALKARGMRRMGAAALDFCYVASGVLDGHWELFLAPWDVAAGALIISEAGGKVTDFSGGDDFLFSNNIVASNGLIHDFIIENLDPFETGEQE